MSSNKVILSHEFQGAGISPPVVTGGPSLLLQTNGPTVTPQGSNLPAVEASWQSLGQSSGYTPLVVNTPFAYVRLVAAAVCLAVLSASASPMPKGGGGGTEPPTIPTNTLTFNGEPLTFNGEYITFGA